MTETNNKRLIIDLEKCDLCESCAVACDYYSPPPADGQGTIGLREKAAFALICRRCEQASCVLACPFHALERQLDGPDRGLIRRYNLRCVSCKSCAVACPFGTIYDEMLPFYQTRCDHCLEHLEAAPPCVASCGQGALEYRAVSPDEKDICILDDYSAARIGPWARQWQKNEVSR